MNNVKILIDALKAVRDTSIRVQAVDAIRMKKRAEQALREFEAAEEQRAEEMFDDIIIGS